MSLLTKNNEQLNGEKRKLKETLQEETGKKAKVEKRVTEGFEKCRQETKGNHKLQE